MNQVSTFDATAARIEEMLTYQDGWEHGFARAKEVLEWRERMAAVWSKVANCVFGFVIGLIVLLYLLNAVHGLGVTEGQKRPIVNDQKADKIGMLIETLPETRK